MRQARLLADSLRYPTHATKRNRATYDLIGTISRKEAEEAIAAAREFVGEIASRIRRPKR